MTPVFLFGGVLGTEIASVHLEEFDRDGRIRRRLFADRMRIRVDDSAVRLELSGGAILRGEAREPFRDGRRSVDEPSRPGSGARPSRRSGSVP